MHIPPQARRNRTNGCGELREPLTRAVLHRETSHGGRWPLDRPELNSGYARERHRTRHVGVRMGQELWNSWISGSLFGCDPASSGCGICCSGQVFSLKLLRHTRILIPTGVPDGPTANLRKLKWRGRMLSGWPSLDPFARKNPGLKSETRATHSRSGGCSFVDPKGVLGSRRGFDRCTDPAQARESRSCP